MMESSETPGLGEIIRVSVVITWLWGRGQWVLMELIGAYSLVAFES